MSFFCTRKARIVQNKHSNRKCLYSNFSDGKFEIVSSPLNMTSQSAMTMASAIPRKSKIQQTLFLTNDGDDIPLPSVVDAVTTKSFVYDVL